MKGIMKDAGKLFFKVLSMPVMNKVRNYHLKFPKEERFRLYFRKIFLRGQTMKQHNKLPEKTMKSASHQKEMA